MKKTLLLTFIHGFKGGDDTFGNFPTYLRGILSHALPKVDVVTVTYPKYETRGDLKDCVARFREWLENKVIDIEVANGSASPTIDPSVHVILIGHSMGGIIGAETLILLSSEKLITPPPHASPREPKLNDDIQGQGIEETTFMFPHIQGLLAFDTPFLGIAPGVVSYAAQSHHRTATAAYSAVSNVANAFGWGAERPPGNGNGKGNNPTLALPSATGEAGVTSPSADAAATPSWQRWGKYAMFAGAAGAAAAGGAAALYANRDHFSAGWSWAGSHLEFVGCLARRDELRRRVSAISTLQGERGVGCANIYTCLGKGAVGISSTAGTKMNATAGGTSFSRLRSDIRTFCSLPEDVARDSSDDPTNPFDTDKPAPSSATPLARGMAWIKSINNKATDETMAHTNMFSPTNNPEFYELAQTSRDLLVGWIHKGWYESSGDIAG